jgi:2-C-methyl-D-erythritol 4-phosphate cytidylyltransferase/2-C-methyl-D-erythritol 2,4-cyclodiphosphate synthase
MENPRVSAIIVAGGQGRRMGGELPKQYLPLRGKPLLGHTLRCFESSPLVNSIVLVVRQEDMAYCRQRVLDEGDFRKISALVPGGAERCDSVWVALQATSPEDEIVLVHDGVRPFATAALLERVIAAAIEHRAAIAALPVVETIKVVERGRVVQTPARQQLWRAQTPQAFARELLLEAHAQRPAGLTITDDAVLVERLGHAVHVVEGDPRNAKITTPEDLAWAEHLLEQEEGIMGAKSLRVGQGYDVHRLVEGRKLILGGVEIPFGRGLEGHSDADVLIHAIIDALLGAIGGGDIGRLFPDTDARYKDVSSLVLLERVVQLLREKGARVVNVDAVVLAQRPRLAPHVEEMKRRLASVLGLETERLSLKATTTERLGFVGREEGLAAQAVALVEL